MAKNYEYIELAMNDLVLDNENPRFASSLLVKENCTKVSQQAIINHLLKYSEIIKIANRINEVGELHGAEIITCYKRDEEYVVLEGNRRTCACKLLLNRKLIPEEYKSNFPFVEEETKVNIERVIVTVYNDREAVQAFLSDRHITGVKKWSALEKNNYYMNLFETYRDVKEVKKHTSDTLGIVVKCIKKYQFFMKVFEILRTRYKDIEIEKLDYLPMVDRFMETLVGFDEEVGLGLNFDESELLYFCKGGKEDIYNEIIMLVGEAFLLRSEKRYCSEEELSKIVSSEIYSLQNQKELILADVRIPGLLELIKKYKGEIRGESGEEKGTSTDKGGQGCRETNTSQGTTETDKTDTGPKGSANDKNTGEEQSTDRNTYKPKVKYRPKRTKMEYLEFTEDEAKEFKIDSDSDYDSKIRDLLYDLSVLSAYKHPYSVALLYRTLLEITTKRVYYLKESTIDREHNENNLNQSILWLNNNYLFQGKGAEKAKKKEAIKTYLKNSDLLQILNLYIHHPDPVDEHLILSSWKSMKNYIQAALEVG